MKRPIKFEGLDNAVVGMTIDGDQCRLVYDQTIAVANLVIRDGMSQEEAQDYFDYNIKGTLLAEGPLWMEPYNPDGYELDQWVGDQIGYDIDESEET